MNKHKAQTLKQWNSNPCGAVGADGKAPYGSLAFFDSARESRYGKTDRWMREEIDFAPGKGKKVLEIGHGMGSDLLTFRENGAEVYGIDITPEHHRLAKLNFKLHRQKAVLKLTDAANIPFPSNYFDIVYSNGVLHHTPDTVRCLTEAYRVLKPGGRLILTLYYTYSAFHLFSKFFVDGLLKGKLGKLGYAGLMSTVEYGADGIKVKPLVKTYGKRQLRNILGDFSRVELKTAHFKTEHLSKLGWLIPRFLEKPLGRIMGWYVIALATK